MYALIFEDVACEAQTALVASILVYCLKTRGFIDFSRIVSAVRSPYLYREILGSLQASGGAFRWR
jgi:hypothetical protein